jgi:hypothetical protein
MDVCALAQQQAKQKQRSWRGAACEDERIGGKRVHCWILSAFCTSKQISYLEEIGNGVFWRRFNTNTCGAKLPFFYANLSKITAILRRKYFAKFGCRKHKRQLSAGVALTQTPA